MALIFSDRKVKYTDILTWIHILSFVNLRYLHGPKLGERT